MATLPLRIIKPTRDFMFKRVFRKHPECLISLLNSIYHLEENEQIQKLDFLSEVTAGEDAFNSRSTIIDIHCITQNDVHILIEVQLCSSKSVEMLHRFQLYSAQILVDQWKTKCQYYSQLLPVRCLVFVNFTTDLFVSTFQSDSGVYTFQMALNGKVTNESQSHFLQDYTYVYIPRIKETLANMEDTLLSKWFTFLAQEDNCEVHLDGVTDQNIKLAYLVASDRSTEVMQMYDADRRSEADYLAVINFERSKGKEEGREEGRIDCAKRMKLQSYSTDNIVEVTGFSSEEIETL